MTGQPVWYDLNNPDTAHLAIGGTTCSGKTMALRWLLRHSKDQRRLVVQRHDVAGLLTLTYGQTVHERHVRKYGARPAETRITRTRQATVHRHEEAIPAAERRLGWRAYATTQNERTKS